MYTCKNLNEVKHKLDICCATCGDTWCGFLTSPDSHPRTVNAGPWIPKCMVSWYSQLLLTLLTLCKLSPGPEMCWCRPIFLPIHHHFLLSMHLYFCSLGHMMMTLFSLLFHCYIHTTTLGCRHNVSFLTYCCTTNMCFIYCQHWYNNKFCSIAISAKYGTIPYMGMDLYSEHCQDGGKKRWWPTVIEFNYWRACRHLLHINILLFRKKTYCHMLTINWSCRVIFLLIMHFSLNYLMADFILVRMHICKSRQTDRDRQTDRQTHTLSLPSPLTLPPSLLSLSLSLCLSLLFKNDSKEIAIPFYKITFY